MKNYLFGAKRMRLYGKFKISNRRRVTWQGAYNNNRRGSLQSKINCGVYKQGTFPPPNGIRARREDEDRKRLC